MGLFKKKTDYSYYSSYSSSRRRLKVGRTVIAVIAAVVVILGIIIYFNFICIYPFRNNSFYCEQCY